jgi:hypothetical protein
MVPPYILPVLIGNILGGVLLVTALNHAQVTSPRTSDLVSVFVRQNAQKYAITDRKKQRSNSSAMSTDSVVVLHV